MKNNACGSNCGSKVGSKVVSAGQPFSYFVRVKFGYIYIYIDTQLTHREKYRPEKLTRRTKNTYAK